MALTFQELDSRLNSSREDLITIKVATRNLVGCIMAPIAEEMPEINIDLVTKQILEVLKEETMVYTTVEQILNHIKLLFKVDKTLVV